MNLEEIQSKTREYLAEGFVVSGRINPKLAEFIAFAWDHY